MQIPILSGIYAETKADYRIAYPQNMRPIAKDTGISSGYLRPVDGLVSMGTGPGTSRGAINWNGQHYRVMGDQLCRIDQDGDVTQLGDVGDDGKPVTLTYDFDRLAIASNGDLFYYDDGTLTQVTDEDLGTVIDVVWIDGYFMTTDGEFLVVTELNDPTSVSPLKYGSSEIDPDPIVSLVKQRNEVYAVNRYSIEVFDNLGGENFPFGRIEGAQVQRGAFGTHCAIAYEGGVAFLGSGVGESPGVFLAKKGGSEKVSTREIDMILSGYTETQLSTAVLEVLLDKGSTLLWIRLPDQTIVFDVTTSSAIGAAVWYTMTSGTDTPYRGIDAIWVHDNWWVGDLSSSDVGVLDNTLASHFGSTVSWEFSTAIIYGEGKGAVFHAIELVGLPGRQPPETEATITTSYSLDGVTWSADRSLLLRGYDQRMVWRRQGNMRHYRIQRFQGDSDANLAVARLEATIERLEA